MSRCPNYWLRSPEDQFLVLIDTHCHLDFDSFDEDREAVIQRAANAGVSKIIVPSLDLSNCSKVIRLAEAYENVYAAVGIHPNSASGWLDQWIKTIELLAAHEKVVAIGEIGLDYYRDKAEPAAQIRALQQQLELAIDLDLPVILHNRNSDADLIGILRNFGATTEKATGVLHSFSSGLETAEAALDLGYYLGFSGPVTFKKADDLRQIASKIPVNRIVVETDAPFLAPQQYRGKRNEPSFVVHVAEQLASLHRMDVSEFSQMTAKNAISLFGGRLA